MVHRTRARAQRRHKLPFDACGKSRLESLSRAEEIKRLDGALIFTQPGFREKFCTADPATEFISPAPIYFCLAAGVRVCAVQSRLKLPGFIQLLHPQARGITLCTGRMVRCDVNHLLKTFARAFVIEVVECFITLGAQRIELFLS